MNDRLRGRIARLEALGNHGPDCTGRHDLTRLSDGELFELEALLSKAGPQEDLGRLTEAERARVHELSALCAAEGTRP